MSFWKAQVSFPSNFASIFSAIKNKSSVLFLISNIIYFDQKDPIKMQIFETFECSGQNLSNCGVNFEKTSQFLFKFCIILCCHGT